jgi:hypothetical protein
MYMNMYINLDEQRRRAAVDEGARQAAVMDMVVWWCGVWGCGDVVWWYGYICGSTFMHMLVNAELPRSPILRPERKCSV